MDFRQEEDHRAPNPLESAGLLSKILFSYAGPVFRAGYKKRDISEEDLFKVTNYDSSDYQGDLLEKHWRREELKSDESKRSLHKALIRAYGSVFLLYGLGTLFKEALKVSQPILMGLIVDYFSVDSTYDTWLAYLYATLLAINMLLVSAFHGPFYWGMTRLGMNVRCSLCTLTYKKVLGLSSSSLREISTGRIHVMMTADVKRFDHLFVHLHYVWMGPLEAICVLVLLYFQIGWACLPGYIVMFGIIAGQTWMSKVFVKLRARVVQYTDKRVTLMSEIITAMRTIKMNACEQVFTELVRKVRNSEYYRMLMSAYATGINLVLVVSGIVC
ncbi:putative multidrug resistance-associated protein 4-like isoform X2 [Apostichopus japonicus]|uniref:Putative multidrug resistance-associated protein 4-like isoform X2 n=1 Tax=Stichopus japonicus TaxID=307972 RepID=A0A2G8JIC8_STIJA|nr:putative multidrug resistance-associated protein 4-like isoform X2 [Apostichopus japonicus]